MTHLFLSHLSHNNNKPSIVEELFNANADDVQIIVTSRFKESALYTIAAAENETRVIYRRQVSVQQLSFSFT